MTRRRAATTAARSSPRLRASWISSSRVAMEILPLLPSHKAEGSILLVSILLAIIQSTPFARCHPDHHHNSNASCLPTTRTTRPNTPDVSYEQHLVKEIIHHWYEVW